MGINRTFERSIAFTQDERNAGTEVLDRASLDTQAAEPLLRSVMPELDTIRGLAILAVLFHHGFFWRVDLSPFSHAQRLFLSSMWAGRFGVNLFFVLSGFLITGLLLDSRRRDDYFSRFYIRRLLRILPAYLVTALVLLLTAYAPANFVLLSFLYLSNLAPLFGVAIAYPILWSLAVEEHFYLLWPTVVRKLENRHLLIFCTFIVSVSPLLRLVTFYLTEKNGYTPLDVYNYTWNSADGLASGAIVAILLRAWQPSRQKLLRCVAILVAAALVILAAGIPLGILTRQTALGASIRVIPWHLAFVALLICFLMIGSSSRKDLVQGKVLRFLGEISYGLYLYHVLLFAAFDYLVRKGLVAPPRTGPFSALVFRFVVVSVVSILIAVFSKHQMEDRFLALKAKFTRN